MANALELLKKAQPDRKIALNRAGGFRGFRSAPGAPNSPRDTMANLTGGVGVNGGMTPASNWNAFFGKTPSLAPVAPIDTADMASAMDESAFFQDPTPSNPKSYIDAATASSDKFFSMNGASRPAFSAAAPAMSGDGFRSKYGYGFTTSGRDRSYAEKLKRLTATSSFSDYEAP